MKIAFDKEKSKEVLSGFMKNTVEFSKKTAENAKISVANMVEKSKEESYAKRLKKYNPLFPEQYQSESFHLPNIIMIVDDAVRRDIDVCQGAIGWLSSDAGSEVLYLYDEAVEFSGIQFIPKVACDTVYCVDNFDRNRYIQSENIFTKAHDERLAELENIAYCLGAQKCIIEISEATIETHTQKKSMKVSESFSNGKANEGFENNTSQTHGKQRSGRIEIEFQNNTNIERPKLKWFAYDDNIKSLIDMCCDGRRAVKSKILELSGSSSATMSQKTACTVDAIISGSKINSSLSMASQAANEHHSKLVFQIEF